MAHRYQVFTHRGAEKPNISAPWYCVASLYSTFFCSNGDYCCIVDAKRNAPVMEWGRAVNSDTRSET
ncbi:hypothetical protein C6P88_16615 [Burkholderia contaminans]|nr:hypothetical protein C6P88_16615 [Burkholderia contaminans]